MSLEDFALAASDSVPTGWTQTLLDGSDLSNAFILWESGSDHKGVLRISEYNETLCFDELRVEEGSQGVFRNLCKNLPPVARDNGIKHFVVTGTSDQMRTLLSDAGFVVVNLGPSDNEELTLSLVSESFSFFGPDVWYANVETPGPLEDYGNAS